MFCFVLAVLVGCVLFVVPGIYLAGALFLFVPAIVLDGKGAIESLSHSYQLVTRQLVAAGDDRRHRPHHPYLVYSWRPWWSGWSWASAARNCHSFS